MPFTPLTSWPRVSHLPEDILLLYGKSPLGLDFEWDKEGRPTILGLSDGDLTVSVRYDDGRDFFLKLLQQYPQTVITGHNLVGADLFVCEAEGLPLRLDQIEDTIIRHYLVNMNLCKTSKKDSDDESFKRGAGFMNIWGMCSTTTNLPYWKECRAPGEDASKCSGPCPIHSPFEYNGMDALAPVQALPGLKRTMLLRGVEKLYPLHRELAYVLGEMSRYGVKVDVPYIDTLRGEFDEAKLALRSELPFNPESPKQIQSYFKERKIRLDDTSEDTVRAAVEKYDDSDVDPLAVETLTDLLDYKELGDGPDRWFLPVYRDKNGWERGFLYPDGFLHPHLGFYTSSGRLMCAGPNLQNVPKRRLDRKVCECGHRIHEHGTDGCAILNCGCKQFKGRNLGKLIRRAIIAPEGLYIVRADYSNAENRVFLYLAGYEAPTTDLHNWMVANIGLQESDLFSIRMGSARDASKSVTHATDYGEGLQLLTKGQMLQKRIRSEIDAGARLAFPDWTFRGKVVTFTGVNLARRAFGSATWENRKEALTIAERYLGDNRALGSWPTGAFPKLRDLQRSITKQVEDERMVRVPTGYAVLSYGQDEDRIKQAMAIWGSNPVAHVSKQALIDLARKFRAGRPMRPVMQIHDEILSYVPLSVDPVEAGEWLRESMEQEVDGMPGFVVPTDRSHGPNWRDQTKLKK